MDTMDAGLSTAHNVNEIFYEFELGNSTENSADIFCDNRTYDDFEESSQRNTTELFYTPSFGVTVAVLTVSALVIVTGIVGNILVLVIIAAVKSMHTNVNKCLFSVGIADLIVLVFLPAQPTMDLLTWDTSILGENLCRFLIFYDRVAVSCSVLLFLYVTVDRYIALCYPLNPRRFSTGRKIYVILVTIWVIALVLSIPYLYMSEFGPCQKSVKLCHYCRFSVDCPWELTYDVAGEIIVFLIPVPFLTYLYGRMIHKVTRSVPVEIGDVRTEMSGNRRRKQVVILLLAVVVMFVLCRLPCTIFILLDGLLPSVFTFQALDTTSFGALWTCRISVYINSAINPILYVSFSSNFRKSFLKLFKRCIKKNPLLSNVTDMSTTTSGTDL